MVQPIVMLAPAQQMEAQEMQVIQGHLVIQDLLMLVPQEMRGLIHMFVDYLAFLEVQLAQLAIQVLPEPQVLEDQAEMAAQQEILVTMPTLFLMVIMDLEEPAAMLEDRVVMVVLEVLLLVQPAAAAERQATLEEVGGALETQEDVL